jgi:hypothetical protein
MAARYNEGDSDVHPGPTGKHLLSAAELQSQRSAA